MARMPTLFISHGSPMLAVVDSAARRFLEELGPRLPAPSAVVVLSAHYDTSTTEVTAAARPATIHDFGGFPDELYRLALSRARQPRARARDRVVRFEAAELPARLAPTRGLDHGAWIPLSLMFPRADVPVLQVSIDTGRSPQQHFALGRALRTLRDANTLVLGSGGATHNLAAYAHARGRTDDSAPPEWVEAFNEWIAGAVAARRLDDLFRYSERAPYAAQNHPTAEHFLPLFVTLGAAYDDEPGVRIHASYDRGLLSLDAYAFGLAGPPREIRLRSAAAAAPRSTLENRMQLKPIIQALAVVWLVLFAASFVVLQTTESDGSAHERPRAHRRVPDVAGDGVRRRRARRVHDAVRGFARRRARQDDRLRAARAERLPRRVVHRADGVPPSMSRRCSNARYGSSLSASAPIGPGLSGATKMRWMCRSLKRHRPSSPRT